MWYLDLIAPQVAYSSIPQWPTAKREYARPRLRLVPEFYLRAVIHLHGLHATLALGSFAVVSVELGREPNQTFRPFSIY
jgi:hypothetical protein